METNGPFERSVFRLVGDNVVPTDPADPRSHAFTRLLPFLPDFPSEIGEIRQISLELQNGDPVEMAISIPRLRNLIMAGTAMKPRRRRKRGNRRRIRGYLLGKQLCTDSSGKLQISRLLPGQGNLIPAMHLAHLMAHLTLPLFRYAHGQEGSYIYERTLYDPDDRRIIRVVYGSRAILIGDGEISAHLCLLLARLNSLVFAGQGVAEGELVALLKAQRDLHDEPPMPVT